MALGVGGLPRGRIVECYGQESSGKTTLALHVVANAQKAGGVAAFIDAEHALDPQYMSEASDFVSAYITHSYGGAYQAVNHAKRKGKVIFNLANSSCSIPF